MPKLNAILAEESIQKQAAVFLNRDRRAPFYKPVYYSEQLETSYMRIFNKMRNRCTRWRRFLSSFVMQEYFSPRADRLPLLKNKLVLVTGGSDGLGFETSLKLVLLGATVVVASDNLYKADRAVQAINALLELGSDKMDFALSNLQSRGPEGVLDAVKSYRLARPVLLVDQDEESYGHAHSIFLNLSDLQSVADCAQAFSNSFPGKIFDHVILAASMCPADNVFSMQGHEIAFATNVLGHFSLVNLLLQHKMLRIESQVLVVGCEDYILADDCTTDFTFPEEEYGHKAYRRSKLGLFWFAKELQRRYNYLSVCIVHPGYLDTRLGKDSLYIRSWLTAWTVLSPRSAADVLVVCVQYGSTLPKGVYYHNTCGQMVLDPREIALNEERAGAFWEMLHEIWADYMRVHRGDHSVSVKGSKIITPDGSPAGYPREIALN